MQAILPFKHKNTDRTESTQRDGFNKDAWFYSTPDDHDTSFIVDNEECKEEISQIVKKVYSSDITVNIDNVTATRKGSLALEKVGALMIPGSLINDYKMLGNELKGSYTTNLIFKSLLTGILWFTTYIVGIQLAYLILGLILLASLDYLLGLSKRNIEAGTEAHQKLQVKFHAFGVNFLVLFIVTKVSEIFTVSVPWVHIVSTVGIIMFLFTIYLVRIVGYVARANNTKVPKTLSKLFDDQFRS